MSNVVKVSFGQLALHTTFTMRGYFSQIYEKVGPVTARQLGCSDPTEAFVELEADDEVRPVFEPNFYEHEKEIE